MTEGLGVSRGPGTCVGGTCVSQRDARQAHPSLPGPPAQAPATGAGSRSKGLEDDLADPSWWLRPQESRAETRLRIRLQEGRFQLGSQNPLGIRVGGAQALGAELGAHVIIMHLIDEDSNAQRSPLSESPLAHLQPPGRGCLQRNLVEVSGLPKPVQLSG